VPVTGHPLLRKINKTKTQNNGRGVCTARSQLGWKHGGTTGDRELPPGRKKGLLCKKQNFERKSRKFGGGGQFTFQTPRVASSKTVGWGGNRKRSVKKWSKKAEGEAVAYEKGKTETGGCPGAPTQKGGERGFGEKKKNAAASANEEKSGRINSATCGAKGKEKKVMAGFATENWTMRGGRQKKTGQIV